jgi:hypothetical protein
MVRRFPESFSDKEANPKSIFADAENQEAGFQRPASFDVPIFKRKNLAMACITRF